MRLTSLNKLFHLPWGKKWLQRSPTGDSREEVGKRLENPPEGDGNELGKKDPIGDNIERSFAGRTCLNQKTKWKGHNFHNAMEGKEP